MKWENPKQSEKKAVNKKNKKMSKKVKRNEITTIGILVTYHSFTNH